MNPAMVITMPTSWIKKILATNGFYQRRTPVSISVQKLYLQIPF
jgi:hypothetical protein